MITALLAFTIVAALMTVTPGMDTALVLRTALVEGRGPAFRTGLGIGLGCLTWGIVTALGLSALIAASELAYTVLKYVGAAYLVWLGVNLLMSGGHVPELGPAEPRRLSGHLRRGFLTNVLNPKVGVFYVAFFPQFVPAGANTIVMTLVMAGIHAALGILWFVALGATAHSFMATLRDTSFVKWIDRVTGALFVGLAVRLAVSTRS